MKKLGVKHSIAAVGEPRENGYAERLMRTIQEEEVELSDYQNFAEPMIQIGYFTPKEFEEQWKKERERPTTTQT